MQWLTRVDWLRPTLWLCLGAAFAVNLGAIWNAVDIGGDEHFELAKAVLWARGHVLYEEVWSDQPPLYTIILGSLIWAVGPVIGAARTLSVVASLLLTGALFCLASKCSGGRLVGIFAALLFVAAPKVYELSISAMQQIPAFAAAICGLWLAVESRLQKGRFRLILSAAAFSVALQMKLTTVVVAPAILTALLPIRTAACDRRPPRDILMDLVLWSGCVAANQAHRLDLGASSTALTLFGNHPDGILAAALGILLALRRGDCHRLRIPLVWLATVALVHAFQRPWWYYYSLHFAIPLAWLAGYALASLMNAGRVSNPII